MAPARRRSNATPSSAESCFFWRSSPASSISPTSRSGPLSRAPSMSARAADSNSARLNSLPLDLRRGAAPSTTVRAQDSRGALWGRRKAERLALWTRPPAPGASSTSARLRRSPSARPASRASAVGRSASASRSSQGRPTRPASSTPASLRTAPAAKVTAALSSTSKSRSAVAKARPRKRNGSTAILARPFCSPRAYRSASLK